MEGEISRIFLGIYTPKKKKKKKKKKKQIPLSVQM